MKQHDTLV